MASHEGNLATLLSKKIALNDLVLGKSMQHVAVRILRMWEARNFKLNGTLMSLDFLLLDEKETLIQGSIYHRRIDKYKDLLEEGKIYLISNFEVVPTYTHYKVTDNPFTIRFMDTTHIVEVAEDMCSIKVEKFRLHTYAEINRFVGTNIHLFDVVGQILQVQGSNLEDSSSTQKIVLLLLLQDNETVRVTLWDEQASNFREKFHQTNRENSVIVCTCLNPKMFAGKLYLNSTGSTKTYFSYELEAVQEFMQRMGIEVKGKPPTIVEEHNLKNCLELWTIQQIFDYIHSGTTEEKELLCRAKVIGISNRKGWKYLSCATCSKKLGRSATSLICNSCNKSSTIGVARFRVELEVESGDRSTTFVLFDRDARKLTHTTAEEIANEKEMEANDSLGLKNVPKCLTEIVGKTMEFQIKITEYNFRASSQTFTVSRVTKENIEEDCDVISKVRKDEGTSKDAEVMKEEKIKTEDGKKRPTFEEEKEKGYKKKRLI